MVKIDKRLKVGLYVGELPAPTFINRLAEALSRSGLEVTMYGLVKKSFPKSKGIRYSGARDGYKEGRNSKFLRFLKYGFLLSIFRPTDKKKLDNWQRENNKIHWSEKSLVYPILWDKPEIIHVQWAKSISYFGWVQLFEIKFVLSLRGAHINYSPLSNPELATLYKQFFPVVDGFHGVSKAICRKAEPYGATPEKCQVVYSGFDLKKFPKSNWVDKSLRKKEEPLQIISVGRSHWKKGYHFAMHAMKLLKDRKIPFLYSIIGALGNEELLFLKTQLELQNEVIFLDRMPFKKVKELIATADVLLLPSVEEGIANVVLEAMALGTLVVTTNCGGMAEVITHKRNGLLVDVRNVDAISDALQELRLLTFDEKQQMIESAYATLASQHSEANMVSDMKKLYAQVLGERN